MAILTESEKLKLKNMEICLLKESKQKDIQKSQKALTKLNTLYEIELILNL